MTDPVRLVGRLSTWADAGVALLATVATLFLCVYTIDPERSDWIAETSTRIAVYGAAALMVGIGLWRARLARTTRVGALRRTVTYAIAALLVVMAGRRASRPTPNDWRPNRERADATPLSALSSVDRVEWGARVAMHRVTTQPRGRELSIPDDWAFPADVRIAIEQFGGDSVRVWARTPDDTTRCARVPDNGLSMQMSNRPPVWKGCGHGVRAPEASRFQLPQRVAQPATAEPLPMFGDPWSEYRRDGRKSATSVTPGSAIGWRTTLDGEMRSSVSIVGNSALIGAHGSGSLAEYSLTTGQRLWQIRLPNWIHMDAVSDGRVAVVGFGNNGGSFYNKSPSGVSAFALGTGRLLWTRFDETSVMTSPVVHDTVVVYASAAGVVRKRSIATGALVAEARLPGAVIMAPPASSGDTIVFTQDHHDVCALLMSTLKTLWCRGTPSRISVGHAAPTIFNGTVIVSGVSLLRDVSLREFARLPWKTQRAALRMIIWPKGEFLLGQRFQAFRLRDGAPLWTSRLFPNVRSVVGHTAGTAAIRDSIGVMVLPSADTLAAFDVRTGRELWTADAHESRGPPLLLDDMTVNAGHDGTIDVRETTTGQLRCTMTRKGGYDRSGPTVAGDLVLFPGLDGELEAIPKSALLACDASRLTRAARTP
ncbi:MAG: PQQ-binding-like beta-propeller repeat protein [Gemmatimonas sp.]